MSAEHSQNPKVENPQGAAAAAADMWEIPPDCMEDFFDLRSWIISAELQDRDDFGSASELLSHISDSGFFTKTVLTEQDRATKEEAIHRNIVILEDLESSEPQDIKNIVKVQLDIGYAYKSLGNHQKVLEYLKPAIETKKKILSSNHLELTYSYNTVATTYLKLGNSPKAIEYLELSLTIYERNLPTSHPVLVSMRNNIRDLPSILCNYQKSSDDSKKASDTLKKASADHQKSLDDCQKSLDDIQKALEYTEQALEIFQKKFLGNHIYLANIFGSISKCYTGIGNQTKALEYYTQAAEIMKNPGPTDGINIDNISTKLAKLKLQIDEKIQKAACAASAAAVSSSTGASSEDGPAQEEDVTMSREKEQPVTTTDTPARDQASAAQSEIKYLTNCPTAIRDILNNRSEHLSPLDIVNILRGLNSFDPKAKYELSDQMKALGAYAQQIWDEQKIEEYPYGLAVLAHLTHLCANYDELCKKMIVALQTPWAKWAPWLDDSDAPEVVTTSIDSCYYGLSNSKHHDTNLAEWQLRYESNVLDIEATLHKIQHSMVKEKVTDIALDSLEHLTLPPKFTIDTLPILQECSTHLLDLYTRMKGREFGLLMDDARDSVEFASIETQQFVCSFEREAILSGGVIDYFEVLNGSG